MIHQSLSAFTRQARQVLAPKGAVALVLIEDDVEVESTLLHLLQSGFSSVVGFGTEDLLPDPREMSPNIHLVVQDMHEAAAMSLVLNAMIAALPGRWLHYCYNGEYLFYPFCETRTVGEMLAFVMEERRDTVMTYVIDLYSNDLGATPNAVSLENAHLDSAGYYALARHDDEGHALDRQLDFFGGLRWRFEEHVPWTRRRIDRVGLFRAKKGLTIGEDHLFSDPEYNTVSCPWHHNLSATIMSFRTAKALMSNPGSMYAIPHFWWQKSMKFDWNSRQLLDLGFMEPGQWF